MEKRAILGVNANKERDIFFVKEDRSYLRKQASNYHPEIASYIEKAKPLADMIQVLLTALGATEFWSQNVNGDRFGVPALSHYGDDYGYNTFQTNANYFIHHVNKDPALAKGKVLKSVWNDKMKRVELIVGIDPRLDPDASTSIDRGEDLAFSMGTKVPYDICSICANRARTRDEYCDHLRYQMGQMDPYSGRQIGAWNTLPKFFDISRVLIPADKTAYMWTKVAGAGNVFAKFSSAELAQLPPGKIADLSYLHKVAEEKKEGAVAKSAEITKRIPIQEKPKFIAGLEKSIPPAKHLLESRSPVIPSHVLFQMKALNPSLAQLASTFAALGMIPKNQEVALFLGSEDTPESILKQKMSIHHFSEALAQLLAPFAAQRSYSRPLLMRRILHLEKHAEEIAQIARPAPAVKHDPIPSGAIAGMLAAFFTLFGTEATQVTKNLGSLIAKHPFLAVAAGAGALHAYRTLQAPVRSGSYSPEDPTTQMMSNGNGLYRYMQMQNRPLQVVKTANDQLVQRLYYGLPLTFITDSIVKLAENSPEMLAGGLFIEGGNIGQRVADVVDSGKRLTKTASLKDAAFLESVPGSEQDLLWDLAILEAAQKISC